MKITPDGTGHLQTEVPVEDLNQSRIFYIGPIDGTIRVAGSVAELEARETREGIVIRWVAAVSFEDARDELNK